MRKQSMVIAVFVTCSLLPTAVVRGGHHGHWAGNTSSLYSYSFANTNNCAGYGKSHHGQCHCLLRNHSLGGSGYCGSGTDAYGAGCGSAGCGSEYSTGTQYFGSGSERVIYDGPAAGSTIYEGPTSGNTETTYPDETRNNSPTRIQFVSNTTQDGSVAFKKGLELFRSRQLSEALGLFETAVAAEPSNAMYQYHVALALYDLHGADAAGDSLKQAVELEQREPIANWGKRMERVQGPAQSWIETARRKADLVRRA